MKAFLYFSLTGTDTYKQPLLEQVKSALPHIATFDLDAQSGKLIQHYALQLLHQAEQAVVCIKANESITDFGALMPLLDELFQENPIRLVLLQGQHARLQRMFEVRTGVNFKAVKEEEVVQEVQAFLGASLKGTEQGQ